MIENLTGKLSLMLFLKVLLYFKPMALNNLLLWNFQRIQIKRRSNTPQSSSKKKKRKMTCLYPQMTSSCPQDNQKNAEK